MSEYILSDIVQNTCCSASGAVSQFEKMGPPPVVTGISPKEGPPGTRVTIRGEFLGTSAVDLVGKPI